MYVSVYYEKIKNRVVLYRLIIDMLTKITTPSIAIITHTRYKSCRYSTIPTQVSN